MDVLFERLLVYIPLLLSLTVHEWAHAWTAWKLGDDTARMMGRVSLNPVDHIDPVGTLLPLLGVPFGWAKPVPVNPVRFRHSISMPLGLLLTAASGPLSNLVIAGLTTLAYVAVTSIGHARPSPLLVDTADLLQFVVVVNVLLAVFNLIPIPPLDGSRIVEAVVPPAWRSVWDAFCAVSPFVLAAIVLLPLVGMNVFETPVKMVQDFLLTLTDISSRR